jgi:hypothetical protein
MSTSWSARYPIVPRFGSAELGLYPIFPRFGGAEVGLALIVLAVVVSARLGVRWRNDGSSSQRSAVALNLVCVVLLLPVGAPHGHGARGTTKVVVVHEPLAQPGLRYNGTPVRNIYPYSLDGKLLHDVLLYDGAGAPIEIGAEFKDPNRRVLTTSSSAAIFNAFPIRYYEPGTARVAHPNASPTLVPMR